MLRCAHLDAFGIARFLRPRRCTSRWALSTLRVANPVSRSTSFRGMLRCADLDAFGIARILRPRRCTSRWALSFGVGRAPTRCATPQRVHREVIGESLNSAFTRNYARNVVIFTYKMTTRRLCKRSHPRAVQAAEGEPADGARGARGEASYVVFTLLGLRLARARREARGAPR